MPDISMCQDDKCTKKENCYRYMARPSYRQSYIINPVFDNEYETCGFYWPNKIPEQSVLIKKDVSDKLKGLSI